MDQTPTLFYEEGTCALGALISLVALDQPFRVCRLEEDDHENPDFLKLNALGEVPTLFLNGVVLTENVAVLQHIGLMNLDRKLTYAPKTPEFDQVERALGFLSSSFHKSFGPMFGPEDLHPDEKIQKQITENWKNNHLRGMIEHVEKHMLKTPLMFNHLALPDAYLFAMARWLKNWFDVPKEFPHLARFQQEMEKLPAVQTALQIESGKLKEGKGNFIGATEFKTFVAKAADLKLAHDRKQAELFPPQNHWR